MTYEQKSRLNKYPSHIYIMMVQWNEQKMLKKLN